MIWGFVLISYSKTMLDPALDWAGRWRTSLLLGLVLLVMYTWISITTGNMISYVILCLVSFFFVAEARWPNGMMLALYSNDQVSILWVGKAEECPKKDEAAVQMCDISSSSRITSCTCLIAKKTQIILCLWWSLSLFFLPLTYQNLTSPS